MSHATGKVHDKNNKVVGYFEYDGINDYAVRKLYKSSEEMWEHVSEYPENSCSRNQKLISCLLTADYGNGLEWWSDICFHCMTIVGNNSPYPNFHRDYDSYGS